MINIPVLTIDGPSGSGKGTVAQLIAKDLGWHYLDSGALYRVLAQASIKHGFELGDEDTLIKNIAIRFEYEEGQKSRIFVNGEDFTDKIRTEKVALLASKIAKDKQARDMLEVYQRSYLVAPGLVADGRDMGTVVFPEANIKFYLTASVEKRAERRLNQLKDQGISANLPHLIQKLLLRDRADTERLISPLKPAKEAVIIDTSNMSVSEVFNITINIIRENLKNI